MYPFIPFGVACCVWLFIFGFENTNNLSIGISGKVAAGAALRDHAGMNLLPDCLAYAFDDGIKLSLGHDAELGLGQSLGRYRPYALERLEDGVVNLQPLFLAYAVSALALELGRNFFSPAFQPGIDGLDVDAAIASQATTEFRP